ncbi:MAG: RluA family pseudouridine synthase [Thermoguttaceae bacterium]
MAAEKLNILYEDNHLLAVAKPVGLATMGAGKNKPTLLSLAKDYIKRRYHKPGNVYLGVVSRLDAPVSGVTLFARTSKAAARLSEQFRVRSVDKTYWALVEGILQPASGTLVDHLGKHEGHRRMEIVKVGSSGAKVAELTYLRLKTIRGHSLVEVSPKSGRKHQIRLQFAHHGHPIIGDEKYGSRLNFPSGIALHALRLAIKHPISAQDIILEASLPGPWRKFGVEQPY